MKISKTIIATALTLIAVLAVGTAVFFIKTENKPKKNTFQIDIPDDQPYKNDAYIYFADIDNRFLKAQKHKLLFNTNTRKYAHELIEMLLKGPSSNNFMSAIPKNTKLLSLYIYENQTAVLDFSKEIRENHPGGSQAEILTIYSIVNTLTLNIEDIKSVKILINGKEADTLAGHIALRFPLKENLTIVQ